MVNKKQLETLYLAFLFILGYFFLSARAYGFLFSRLPAPVHWGVAAADTVFAVRRFLSYAPKPKKEVAVNAPSPNKAIGASTPSPNALKVRRFGFMPYRAPTPPRSRTD